MKWISVKDRLPEEDCLVYLEEEANCTYIHVLSYHPNIIYIGGRFIFDMPAYTHWMPLPEAPEEVK